MTLKYVWRSFSLSCHFHVHFSYPWDAFASHGLPAIAELLVLTAIHLQHWREKHISRITCRRTIIILMLKSKLNTWKKYMVLVLKYVQFASTSYTSSTRDISGSAAQEPTLRNRCTWQSEWTNSAKHGMYQNHLHIMLLIMQVWWHLVDKSNKQRLGVPSQSLIHH